MKKTLSTLIAMASILMINATFAADANLKIGIVNINQVFQMSPLMKSIDASLIKKFKPRQDELNSLKTKLQAETDELTLKGSTMTQDEQTNLQNKIIADRADVTVKAANLDRDLTIAKNEYIKSFMVKLSDAINKVAKDGQYDLIQQQTNVLFVDSKLDATQKVIQLLQ